VLLVFDRSLPDESFDEGGNLDDPVEFEEPEQVQEENSADADNEGAAP
jgi:hypothetical protein